jgi:hypothetical protein
VTARAPRLRAVGAAPARPAVAGVAPGSVFGTGGPVAVEVALDPEPAAVEVLADVPGPAVEVLPGSAFAHVVRPAALDEAA